MRWLVRFWQTRNPELVLGFLVHCAGVAGSPHAERARTAALLRDRRKIRLQARGMQDFPRADGRRSRRILHLRARDRDCAPWAVDGRAVASRREAIPAAAG